MKQFRAYANGGAATIAETPKAAAVAFFAANPNKRKCDIVAGVKDGQFFTVSYGRASLGEWPESYKDVTKKTAQSLPGN